MAEPPDNSPFAVRTSLREVFARFACPFDIVRNQREQRELYEKFIIDLEKLRHGESASRDYVAAELTKAQLRIVRQELRKLAIYFEEKRQEKENKAMEKASTKVKNDVTEKIEDDYEDVLDKLYHKEFAMYNLHEQQVVSLEQEISREPLPKPRYTKRTIELRHAERLLAQQQDYFNAARVRTKTKELEAKEDALSHANFENRMQRRRDKLYGRHDGESKRLFEDVKKAKAVAARNREHSLKLVKNRMKFLEDGMRHGHVMHKHKVLGTTHNIELEPRKPSKETLRGSTYMEMKIGKPHMAIASLAATHVFDTEQKQIVEEARPRTATPAPNFRDPMWRMSARIEMTRPASRALTPGV